jgi:hypothetical protein
MPAMACTSSWAWAITGEAPAANSTLALRFITTKLVMLCTKGLRSRTEVISAQTSEGESKSVMVVLFVNGDQDHAGGSEARFPTLA